VNKYLTNLQTARNDLSKTHLLLQKTFIIFSFYWTTLKILVGLCNFSLSNSVFFRLRYEPCLKITVLNRIRIICFFNYPWRTLRYWQPLGNQKTQIFSWGSNVVISCDTLLPRWVPTLSSKRSCFCIMLLFTDSVLKVLIATSKLVPNFLNLNLPLQKRNVNQ